MNEIYPDKDKTGIAALKPLLMAYCDEPERWVLEAQQLSGAWSAVCLSDAIEYWENEADSVRLAPKPRRVWIGDQSYPEPLNHVSDGDFAWMADVVIGKTYEIIFGHDSGRHAPAFHSGFLFRDEDSAQQCLDAYRKVRRVE